MKKNQKVKRRNIQKSRHSKEIQSLSLKGAIPEEEIDIAGEQLKKMLNDVVSYDEQVKLLILIRIKILLLFTTLMMVQQ